MFYQAIMSCSKSEVSNSFYSGFLFVLSHFLWISFHFFMFNCIMVFCSNILVTLCLLSFLREFECNFITFLASMFIFSVPSTPTWRGTYWNTTVFWRVCSCLSCLFYVVQYSAVVVCLKTKVEWLLLNPQKGPPCPFKYVKVCVVVVEFLFPLQIPPCCIFFYWSVVREQLSAYTLAVSTLISKSRRWKFWVYRFQDNYIP